jgi:hypothetical protein
MRRPAEGVPRAGRPDRAGALLVLTLACHLAASQEPGKEKAPLRPSFQSPLPIADVAVEPAVRPVFRAVVPLEAVVGRDSKTSPIVAVSFEAPHALNETSAPVETDAHQWEMLISRAVESIQPQEGKSPGAEVPPLPRELPDVQSGPLPPRGPLSGPAAAASRGGQPGSEQLPYAIRLSPPGPVRLFGQLESEEALRDRLRQEALSAARPRYIEFPSSRVTEPGRELLRDWAGLPMVVPPHYVCFKRLFFQQPWTERYGHSLGVVQPMVSASVFFGDVFLFPLKWYADPCWIFQCSHDGYSPFFNPWPPR